MKSQNRPVPRVESQSIRRLLPVLLAAACLAAWPGAGRGETPSADAILKATGVKGGLVVHLGCGNGRLTAALRADERYTVHGLDADPAKVQAAREALRKAGTYGPVSVECLAGPSLPYVDNLVNLVVAEDVGAVPRAEILRVLAPGGTAYVRKGDGWEKVVKPRPADIDEWTHFLHDAGNNAVARDTRVGLPRSMQWLAGPLWLRSHETPSGFEAMVCGGGRVFYLFDEGLIGITDQRLPERWALLCRDAFNGKLLWRRPIEPWGWPEWAADKFAGKEWTTITGGRTVVPNENQRRLVVDGDRLFATLGYRADLAILDAATGKTLATVEELTPVRQILVSGGLAVTYTEQDKRDEEASGKRRGKEKNVGKGASGSGKLAAVKPDGKIVWRKDVPSIPDLSLAADAGRVFFQAGNDLQCLDLQTGKELWKVPAKVRAGTLVAHGGAVVLSNRGSLEVLDASNGKELWQKKALPSMALGGEDLFVIDGVVWPGMATVDAKGDSNRKSPNVLAVGYDLRTGQERKRVAAEDLLSPEHHHRCYRNKATSRYMIGSMEGAEFLDLVGTNHAQNNFLRGACKMGMVPCNGFLYVPPDQCFCQPGGKLLGLAAIASAEAGRFTPVPDERRLQRGPAYGQTRGAPPAAGDWPTFRYNAARHGATPCAVAANVQQSWRAKLGADLTPPVAAGQRVYVAAKDAHTLFALDAQTGKEVWTFIAGGRIDSPPTVHDGRVLLGSADGWVYCLRADDGALAWRFLAAPADRRMGGFDQLESVWPVHGSVLVRDGVAYVAAGRSTYLDGGICLYGLDPDTGKILHRGLLHGPHPDGKTIPRDVAFWVRGANSDVLVSEGDAIYMRQKRLTPALQEQKPEVLSAKGEQDVGLHVFSTSGLLDASWYGRAFWMYSKRWPGFQLANQAPKEGQLLVVDEKNTYAVKVYYRRNVHTTMFFPGKEGYLLFADKNTTEPQIVGEAGARKPLEWLPQSGYDRGSGRGVLKLDSPAFGLDKMIGYTRAEPPLWKVWLPIRINAMVKAGDALFVAGVPDEFDAKDPYASFEGRKGAHLLAVSAKDGTKLSQLALDSPPIFDGMIAAGGRLYVSLTSGELLCLAGAGRQD